MRQSDTPTWLNTLDVTPPTSRVAALPAAETTTGQTATFTVDWSGTDVGTGIASYSVYVSDNGGAFTFVAEHRDGDIGKLYGDSRAQLRVL